MAKKKAEPNGTEAQASPEVVAPVTPPSMEDPGWTDYVLSLLVDKTEKVENSPKTVGLRRVFTQLTGYRIIRSYPTVIQVPCPENERRATVMFSVRAVKLTDSSDVVELADASDCYWANTKAPFNLHPVATAATMAEGRVLRKFLKLNTVTDEEKSLAPTDEESKVNEVMTDASTPIERPQEVALDNICGKMGIDIRKMLMLHQMPVSDDINDKPYSKLSKKDAQMMIQIAIGYQRGTKNGGIDIPEEIKRGNKS